eukprot:m.9731 g.9731  ORF g.9731 m.9731 type:complete len:57 (+) comp2447_c0_seq2:78-248(+)
MVELSGRGVLMLFASGFACGIVAGFFLRRQIQAINKFRYERSRQKYLEAKSRLEDS